MAAKYQPLIDTTPVTMAAVTVFTAVARTVIDAFVVSNTGAAGPTFTANIVKVGGTVGVANQVASAMTIGANAAAWPQGLNGQALNPGDFISVIGSATGLNIRASGRVLTDA